MKRFWVKVDKNGPSGCWLWTAHRNSLGYGKFSTKDKFGLLAHRVSWELINGPIAHGMCVLHKCDNPPCVNPAHLWLGTRGDNTADMISKGRLAVGRARKDAKLTDEIVDAIRKSSEPTRRLMEKYGASRAVISNARHGRSWKHVKTPLPSIPELLGGENGPNARLSREDVLEIKQRRANGESPKEIAQSKGITRTHVWQIVSGRRWAFV